MKSYVIFTISACFLGIAAAIPAKDTYITKYDNVDLDKILQSDRLLKNYVNCLMERGKCTPDGSELKRALPDALENDCSKCSDKQQKGSEKVIRFLLERKPETFKELEAKYDPNGTYRKRFEADFKKKGIIVAPSA